ncbi:hypothetical protein [Chryseobacterium sp. CH25]|uniref:hypothetical protein n=1 Tax=Chryseobacterium sp. CH25 TaxID=713559 RepID=UPI001E3B9568|nr:hypothetical protein [Chryseobacterium sp. CH25]
MKKSIIIFFTILGTFLNAQNIKTKRGIINLDGIPVAKISNKSNEYTFMDLKETPLYTIKFIDKSIVDSVRDSYIQVNRVYNRDKTIEVDYSSPSASPEKRNLQFILP